MLVMIDPYATRSERVYVITLHTSHDQEGAIRTEETELPGRFAYIADALRAYPGARISSQVGRALGNMTRNRRGQRVHVG